MPKCRPGCTCNRHRKCEPGCECGRHKGWRDASRDVKYVARHVRVYNERGKARDHDCVNCGTRAAEWAQIHDTTGQDPSHYQPMCAKCHRAYDDIPLKVSEAQRGRKQSPETIAKRSESLKEAWKRNPRSPEVQERISAAHRGATRSPEARERMRQSALKRHAREREERAKTLE